MVQAGRATWRDGSSAAIRHNRLRCCAPNCTFGSFRASFSYAVAWQNTARELLCVSSSTRRNHRRGRVAPRLFRHHSTERVTESLGAKSLLAVLPFTPGGTGYSATTWHHPPMKYTPYHLTFITPCFCAGAEPSVAEVRAPSIRGKLRWWFRVLGGTFEQESEVFGSIAGDEGNASSLLVRVVEIEIRQKWQPIQPTANSNEGYLLYFAQKSQNEARWKLGGALPPGASFELQVAWRRPVADSAMKTFDLALEAFLVLGSLGLRSTRGLGCFETKEKPISTGTFDSFRRRLQTEAPKFLAGTGKFRGPESQLLKELGRQLRGLRKGKEYSAGPAHHPNPTPLGHSQPRQASAVYIRPVKVGPDDYRIVVFEAPADKVLGMPSRKGAPRLCGDVPPPADPPQRSGRGYGGYHR